MPRPKRKRHILWDDDQYGAPDTLCTRWLDDSEIELVWNYERWHVTMDEWREFPPPDSELHMYCTPCQEQLAIEKHGNLRDSLFLMLSGVEYASDDFGTVE